MGYQSGSDSRYRASEAKARKRSCGDGRVSKHDFGVFQKLTHRPSHEMVSTGGVSGRGRPIIRWRSGRYKWYQNQTQTSVESVRAHTNMGHDLRPERGHCFL